MRYEMGSSDSLPIGVPQAQEVLVPALNASCGYAAPIGKLSGLPVRKVVRITITINKI